MTDAHRLGTAPTLAEQRDAYAELYRKAADERDALKAENEQLRSELKECADNGFGLADEVRRLRAKVDRQKEHNKLLTGALSDERNRRKEVQAACESLRAKLAEAERERDEAKAEAERLTEVVHFWERKSTAKEETMERLKVYARHLDTCACLFAAKPCDCGYGRDVLFARKP